MRNDIEEIIMTAMMCHEPVVIVEGQDDIKFYSNIATLKGLKVDIRAIETIDGYTEGCEHVINAMKNAEQLIRNDNRLSKFVLGIIDRDIRQYRATLPSYNNLLILKYYSYETHLITDNTIKKIIESLTKVPGAMVTQDVIDYIKLDFKSQNNELYYFSLEALKGSCDSSYNADMAYSDKSGVLTGGGKDYKWSKIKAKTDELDDYALSMSISKTDIKYIAKGKWYLWVWCDYLNKKAKTIHELCGIKIKRCYYCSKGKNEKCLWRTNNTFQVPLMESMLNTTSLLIWKRLITF